MSLGSRALFVLGQVLGAAGEINLLLGGANAWETPSRVDRCPAHHPVVPSKAGDRFGNKLGVKFTGGRSNKFSLIEMSVGDMQLDSFAGVQLRFSGAPAAWTLRAGEYSSKTRFVATIEGVKNTSVFVPWRTFKGQHLHRGGIDYNGASVNAQRMQTIGILLPGIAKKSDFILHELKAMNLPAGVEPSLATPVLLNSAGEVTSATEAQCSCDLGCGRCALLEHLYSGICSSSQYSKLCTVSAGGLMRRLAAGFSTPDCTSQKQENARHFLQASQYIEQCLSSHSDDVGPAIQDLMKGLLRTDFSAESAPDAPCTAASSAKNLTGFVGPFVEMGISGYNDLGVTKGITVEACLDLCRANPRCRSIDYGAREKVIGECWLSTANRESAGNAFTGWPLYDYYEVSEDDEATSATNTLSVQTAAEQAALMSAEEQKMLLESAGLLETDCCKQPSTCINGAIRVGVPKYNGGDVVGCFFVYHEAASRIGECGEKGAIGYPLFLKAAAITGASGPSANFGAWQLRRALDIVLASKSGPCGSSFPEEDVVTPVPEPEPEPEPSPSPSPGSASNEITGDLAESFQGPFVGMGISGWNDLGSFNGKTVPDCLAECLKQPRCKSVDYGARGKVQGECWLSTADRKSVGTAYSAWELYDYYERAPPKEDEGSAGAAEQTTETENSQRDALEDNPAASQCNRTAQFLSALTVGLLMTLSL